MKARYLLLTLAVCFVGWFAGDSIAQNPPTNLSINQTKIPNGTATRCLIVNSNKTLGQTNCAAASASMTVDGTLCTLSSSCTPVETLLTSFVGNSVTGNCTGTAYTLTATNTTVTCGTLSPTITLGAAGTYLLLFTARADDLSATFAANRTITFNLNRTNNTPGTIASSFALTGVRTTDTGTAGQVTNFAVFTTANTTDILVVNAGIDVIASAGSTVISQARLTAIRLD